MSNTPATAIIREEHDTIPIMQKTPTMLQHFIIQQMHKYIIHRYN